MVEDLMVETLMVETLCSYTPLNACSTSRAASTPKT
jgi:hypothetical protein